MIRTRRGVIRRYNAVIRAYKRRNASGGRWGFDWPTMAVTEPETYKTLKGLAALFKTLPA